MGVTMTEKTALFPSFYDPARIDQLYLPNLSGAAQVGQEANLPPASQDQRRIMLLLVDVQVDFVFPQGSLAVPGAVEDTRRTVEWIYRNVGELSAISASLDSHTAYQIFYPTWWADEKGDHPTPFTTITTADTRNGRWRPLLEPDWSLEYVERLEEGGKYSLMIWPYHTMLGTPGHALVPALAEAVMYQATARHAQPTWLIKGTIPKTENYSILEPEVKVPEHPAGGLNTNLLNELATYDLVYVAGQAKSHCVLATMRSILHYFADQPAVIAKLRFLMDCTSSIQHPTIDFDRLANDELAAMAKQGMRLVTSTDQIR